MTLKEKIYIHEIITLKRQQGINSRRDPMTGTSYRRGRNCYNETPVKQKENLKHYEAKTDHVLNLTKEIMSCE